MPAFSTTRRVPFTSRQMFDLVADVESYPEFFPLCEALRVTSNVTLGDLRRQSWVLVMAGTIVAAVLVVLANISGKMAGATET